MSAAQKYAFLDNAGLPVSSVLSHAEADRISDLLNDISQSDYPAVYKRLRRLVPPLSPGAAFLLICAALDNGLTLRAVRAILDVSPPLPEILPAGSISKSRGGFGPVEFAAYLDRTDVLSLLLERGAGVNRSGSFGLSPLEAALEGNALSAVELLTDRPELDTAWTPKLLEIWARPRDSDGAADVLPEFCLHTVARRFAGWTPAPMASLPIPEPMTARIIAEAGNWPLLERFCRERGAVAPADGRVALLAASPSLHGDSAQTACARALDALLLCCPGLLRGETACRVLLRCFLRFGEAARDILRPSIRRLRRRSIAMLPEDWNWGGCGDFPPRWQALFPNGPTLVIDRWSYVLDAVCFDCDDDIFFQLFGTEPPPQPSETLRQVLSACPIRGRGRRGKLSPAAQTVLLRGDAALIESLIRQPGGLLATEDPDALIDYLLQDGDVPRANRAAALACVRNEAAYELL